MSRGGSQQRRKYSDDCHRVCRRNGIPEVNAAMASMYYATASRILCAPPARVLGFDRFLHTPPPPHSSHDNRPNRHVAAHIPTPAPIAAHPTRPRLSPQRFKIARPSPRLTPCTQLPLLLFAGTSQLHPARSRSRPGGTRRHPCLWYSIVRLLATSYLPNYDSCWHR